MKKSEIFSLLVVLLAGSFLYFYEAPPLSAFEYRVRNNELIYLSANENGLDSMPGHLRAYQGDRVRIEITAADGDDELYIRGYDRRLALKKDRPGEINFIAELSGEFRLELKENEAKLGILEVIPREQL